MKRTLSPTWNFITTIAIQLVITVLKVVIHNPAVSSEEAAVIAEIAQVATQADMISNGSVWTYTPPPAA